ncbi:unnamed protein product [Plutella xylostella]|uniref:(diamondback moth) hypothetical protein n=1 Tax=Plutella xylostella TaxID=51655 RepID=A0A8S4GAY3_PLUXY|nr:unnamed protein product [Plutella xylostella]
MSSLAPALFISHGGGPMTVLGFKQFAGVRKFLEEDLQKHINLNEWKAIILITAHWEEKEVTISAKKHNELLFDYYNFPPESYTYKYGALGHPEIAQRLCNALNDAGIPAKLDTERGWDHGLFIPMMLINPAANIPIVQISMLDNQDAKPHYEIGKVLQQFRRDGIAILGSGMTYHNIDRFLSYTYKDGDDVVNKEFDDYLTKVCTAENEADRKAGLLAWKDQPGGLEAHPPGKAEHLIPLMMTAGAGGDKPAETICTCDCGAFRLSSYIWKDE